LKQNAPSIQIFHPSGALKKEEEEDGTVDAGTQRCFLERLPPKFGKGKDAFRAFRRINLFKKFASQEKDIIIL
jgi:hypothetical protein